MKEPAHPDSLLVPFVLRTLSQERHRQVKRHIASCARCAKMLTQVKQDVADFAMALEPQMPPAVIKESLMQAIDEVPRLANCIEPLASFLAIDERRAAKILEAVDRPELWQPDTPRVARMHDADMADVTLWKMSPDEQLIVSASHAQATRRVLVLQGFCYDSEGLVLCPAESRHLGNERALTACGPIDLICITHIS